MRLASTLLSALAASPALGHAVNKARARGADLSKAPGYKLDKVTATSSGLTGSLTLTGRALNAYGADIKQLDLLVEYQSPNRLHVHISDTAKKQFQIPSSTFPRPPTSTAAPSDSDLEFHSTDSAFSFWITRRSTSEVIFDTRNHPFVFSDQLLELTTSIPDKNDIYGPGEIVSSSGFRRNPTKDKTTMWNRDAASPTDENMYGSHPFYISSSPGGSFGVFLLNSHGMDMVTQDRTMKYNVLGGTFDFYFLSGPTPMDVIRQYSEVVGKPARMPFWAFGFHMCRWGGDWKTPEGVKGVIQKMKDAGVPFETVWSDLDYMDGLRNFEAKPEWRGDKYKGLVDQIHKDKQHYIPIVDPAIGFKGQNDKYQPYVRGKELKVFIKNDDGKDYVGVSSPGQVLWPDWTANGTQQWWKESFDHYRETAKYDGIWLDKNEPANPQKGRDRPGGNINQKLNSPKYTIHHGTQLFWDGTISPSAKLADGFNHYHEHNIWGFEQNLATHKVLLEQTPGVRPFIITRSTSAGIGRVSGHWLGDNFSSWTSMKQSIQGVLQFQMFQIPMVGADAGGFLWDCTEELANRWMQLAAFTPFFRNHNAAGTKDQEPYRWKSVAEATKKALTARYQLLPYWETLFAQASKDGTPPVRALVFEFPEPQYAGVEEQFLVGPNLLITPVLKEGGKSVKGLFPKDGGAWRDWFTHKALKVDGKNQAVIPTPLGNINVHIRPGSIFLIHSTPAYSLTDTRTSEYGIIISLNDVWAAKGTAILDDGLSTEGPETIVTFEVMAASKTLTIKSTGDYAGAPTMTKVTVLGAGEGDEEKVITGKLDLSRGGSVVW